MRPAHAWIARASAPLAWPPHPGKHTLALVNAAGRRLDMVTFEVRGDRSSGRAARLLDPVGPRLVRTALASRGTFGRGTFARPQQRGGDRRTVRFAPWNEVDLTQGSDI